ncbi:Rha family transcriptional regulator [Providencia rettgeri]
MNTSVTVVNATTPHVTIKNHKAITTSQDVAVFFEKRHERVLDRIKKLDCSSEFTQHNFVLSEYIDSTGRKLPLYEMTKDGFVFLVMGFTGKKAAQFKEAYIAEFNRMEAELYSNKIAPTVSQEERDAYNINALTKHYEVFYTAWKDELRPILRKLESPLVGRLNDRFQDGYAFLKYLQKELNDKLTGNQIPRLH